MKSGCRIRVWASSSVGFDSHTGCADNRVEGPFRALTIFFRFGQHGKVCLTDVDPFDAGLVSGF